MKIVKHQVGNQWDSQAIEMEFEVEPNEIITIEKVNKTQAEYIRNLFNENKDDYLIEFLIEYMREFWENETSSDKEIIFDLCEEMEISEDLYYDNNIIDSSGDLI